MSIHSRFIYRIPPVLTPFEHHVFLHQHRSQSCSYGKYITLSTSYCIFLDVHRQYRKFAVEIIILVMHVVWLTLLSHGIAAC